MNISMDFTNKIVSEDQVLVIDGNFTRQYIVMDYNQVSFRIIFFLLLFFVCFRFSSSFVCSFSAKVANFATENKAVQVQTPPWRCLSLDCTIFAIFSRCTNTLHQVYE